MTTTAHVHIGSAQELLTSLPEESIDAVICDPPYGLTRQTDIHAVLDAWLNDDEHSHDGGGYKNLDWDNSVPSPGLWADVWNTMKPGGYVAAFSAPRTQHLTALGLALGGFEIRDTLAWTYPAGRGLGVRVFADDIAGPTAARADLAHTCDGLPGPRTSAFRGAHEPIVLARKPLEGSLRDNLADHGTGSLGQPGPDGSNVVSVHDLTCTPGACSCGLARLADLGAQTYPGEHLASSFLRHARALSRDDRPVDANGESHPTTKPLGLMMRLVEALTLPGQTVLDPFLGSGTTAQAATLSGRHFVGSEGQPQYGPLIDSRLLLVSQVAESDQLHGGLHLRYTGMVETIRAARTRAL